MGVDWDDVGFAPGPFAIAESFDVGNLATEETALVFAHDLPAIDEVIPIDPSASIEVLEDLIGTSMGALAAHEAGHFLGSYHSQSSSIADVMDSGDFAASLGVGPDGVFGPTPAGTDDVDVNFGANTTARQELELVQGTASSLIRVAYGLSTGSAMLGDANIDGAVDEDDYFIWDANRFTTNKTWYDGDFNQDGSVDVSDFNIWNQNRTDAAGANVIIALAAAGSQSPLSPQEDQFDFYDDDEIKLGGTYGLDADSDLTAYLATIGRVLGDADLDGNVDAVDYGVVMANFNQTGTSWEQGDFNGDGATNFYDLVVWTINMTDDTGVEGDLTNDSAVSVEDIDAMFEGLSVLANTSNTTYVSWLNSMYDLNGDGTIDQLDADYLVENILGTAYGDANLDGYVNATDLNIAVLNLNTSVDSWADGDFNGDGVVDEDDLDLIYANWGFGT